MYPLFTSEMVSPEVPPERVKPETVMELDHRYTPELTVMVMSDLPAI
jgi:hypothetical protein